MTLKSINYDHQDLINLIKQNTAIICDIEPARLFVEFQIQGKRVNVKVIRLDKKEIEINDSHD